MKRSTASIALFSLLLGFALAQWPVHAAPKVDCLGNYADFIFSSQGVNKFEFLKGFTKMSACQQSDILLLNDELNALRDSMKEASAVCESTVELEAEYSKVLLEMYFVRNVLSGGTGVYGPEDIELLEEDREALFDALYSKMQKRFIEKQATIDQETFDLYFDEWIQVYEDRILDYADCDEGDWAALEQPWTNLVETLKGLGKGLKNRKTQDPPQVVEDEDDSEGQNQQNQLNAYEFVQKEKELLESQIEPPMTIGEAAAEHRSFGTVLDALDEDALRVELSEIKAERDAEYAILYGENAAVPTNQVQDMVTQLNAELEEATSTHFPAIVEGIEEVEKRECS